MSLTDMKRSPSRNKSPEVCCDMTDSYPYGLRIELDDAALQKLGITELPAAGEEMIVVGVGPVVSVSQHERTGSSKNRNVSIQLERIEVGPLEEESAEDAVSSAIKDV